MMTAIEVDAVLERLANLKGEVAKLESERDEQIKQLNEQCERGTQDLRDEITILRERLKDYAEAVTIATGKKTLKYQSGALKFRSQAPKFYFNDKSEPHAKHEQLIKFVKASAPDCLKVQTIESVDWAKLKTRLTVDGGEVFYSTTGELIDDLHAYESPDKFIVETMAGLI